MPIARSVLLGNFLSLVRVRLDIGLQDGIDARLVSGTLPLEPVNHPWVEAKRQRRSTSRGLSDSFWSAVYAVLCKSEYRQEQ